jgi:hypothetical protein
VPSETTTLLSSSGRAPLEPETQLLKREFLLNGDRTVDSTFASGLVLAVAELTGDLCENLLLNDCDMCDIIAACCPLRSEDLTGDDGSGTILGAAWGVLNLV